MSKKLPALVVALLLGFFVVYEHTSMPRLEAAMFRLQLKEKSPVLDPEFQGFLNDYESYLRGQLEAEGVPGAAVAIVKDSAVVLMKAYGVRSKGRKDSVDVHSVFRVASLSKGFTGILAALLVDEGLLRWDEPVYEHVLDLHLKTEEYTRQLQLIHLLSHSTGLPRHTFSNLLNMGMSYPMILQRLASVQPTHAVGSYHNYQNVAFSLSGDMMESVTGQRFHTLLEERIFKPLGMDDASATLAGILGTADVAMPHKLNRGGYQPVEIDPNYYEAIPAAGVNASISDMAQWLFMLLGNRPDFASDSLLSQAFQPYIEIPAGDRVLRNWDNLQTAHYAMGWRVLQLPEIQLVGHSGYVNNYRSEIAFSRSEKIGIVLLTNAPNNTVGKAIPAFFQQYLESRKQKEQP
ncbi:MAG: beta-lactamase family protein [Phaeodactylibacter sp.]|nr:beta-lactamase family protein [Phaeodactylibacter sp.]MCB9275406.1 beta-lactamase family protein [Lewinellaceae bacterium]